MNKRLSHLFSASYFLTLIEMSLFNAYFSLYLVQVKNLSPATIASIFSINFLMSLIIGPVVGRIIEKYGSNKHLMIISALGYAFALFTWFTQQSLILIVVSYILYNFTKAPLLRLQDMLAVQSHYEGKIDFGRSRSFAAIGYAVTPLFATTFFSIFTQDIVRYEFVFGMMLVTTMINLAVLLIITKSVSLHSHADSKVKIQVPKDMWKFIIFIVMCNMFFNGTNNYIVGFQTVYLETIFHTTTALGLVVLVGSLFEWPMMQVASRIYEKLGIARVLIGLSLIVTLRWFLYYFAGQFTNYTLFYIASSINGIAQALFVPFASTYVRKISTKETYSRVYTIVAFLGSIASYVFAQGIAVASGIVTMQNMFLVLSVLTVIWTGYLMINSKKIV